MPLQLGDVKGTWVDIAKARRELGYDPKVRVEEGIKVFCDWFKQNKEWLLLLEDRKQ